MYTDTSTLRESLSLIGIPFDSLPTELLVYIFCLSLYYGREYGRFSHIRRLARVCRRWMLVVKATPDLWTVVSTADVHWGSVGIKLQRSGSLPIDIDTTALPRPAGATGTLWSLTIPHRHRWRSLVYHGTDLEVISGAFCGANNVIERLDLSYEGEESHAIAERDFEIVNLRYLVLSQISVPLQSLKLQRLQTLGLSDIELTPTSMIDILNNLRGLVELKLAGIEGETDTVDTSAPSQTVRFQNLRTLILRECPPFVHTLLLAAICAEGLEQLVLEAEEAGEQILEALVHPRHGPNPLSSVLSNRKFDLVAIHVNKCNELLIGTEDKSLDIYLVNGDGQWLHTFARLSDRMPFQADPTPIALEIEIDTEWMLHHATVPFIDAFSSLVSFRTEHSETRTTPLSLEKTEVFARGILEQLLEVEGQYKLPKLRRLEFGSPALTRAAFPELFELSERIMKERRKLEEAESRGGEPFFLWVDRVYRSDANYRP